MAKYYRRRQKMEAEQYVFRKPLPFSDRGKPIHLMDVLKPGDWFVLYDVDGLIQHYPAEMFEAFFVPVENADDVTDADVEQTLHELVCKPEYDK